MDTVNEIEREQRRERATIREDAELLGELMKHKGWARYMNLVEAIAQNYHAGIMKPLENVMDCVRPEFAKGVLSGLSLATSIPILKIRESHELRSNSDTDEE